MVINQKTGEYFGLVDANGILTELWEELPPERPVLVNKYSMTYGTGKPKVEVVTKCFRRDALQLTKEQLISKSQFLSLFQEEDTMSSKAIIESAKTGDVKNVEELLHLEIGRAIKRAIWVAEREDEFLAIPVLQDLSVKYGGITSKGDTTLTEKDGKSVKITKTEKVDDRVWQAILKKASKIGAIVKSAGNRAELIIRKKEVETFVKATKAVSGVSVEA